MVKFILNRNRVLEQTLKDACSFVCYKLPEAIINFSKKIKQERGSQADASVNNYFRFGGNAQSRIKAKQNTKIETAQFNDKSPSFQLDLC